MKVAHLVFRFPTLSETFVQNQIIGLLETGVAVHVYSVLPPSTGRTVSDLKLRIPWDQVHYYPEPSSDWRKRLIGVFRTYRRSSRKLRLAILRSLNPFRFGTYGFSLGFAETLQVYSEAGPYDIIHSQFLTDAATALNLRHCGVVSGKLIASVRGFDLREMEQNRKKELRRVLDAYDLFLPVNRSLADRLVNLGCPSQKVQVHHSGIRLQDFSQPEEPRRTHLILSVGRLVEKKGMIDLIEAISILRDRKSPVTLEVIGDGPELSNLQLQIKRLDLETKVRLRGAQDHREVRAAYQRARVFVLPSRTAANGDTEGIPNSLKEAMAAGLPVVSTRHGGIPELINDGESGFLVAQQSPLEIADAIQKVFALSPFALDQISRNAIARIDNFFDIKKLSRELAETYNHLIQR